MKKSEHRAAAWIYRGVWAWLVRWFRVPERPPELPSGSADLVETFRPADGFLRYLKFQFWIILIIVDVVLFGIWAAVTIAYPRIGLAIAPLALAIIVLPDVLVYIGLHLRYDTTWYLISDRALRIRRGIWVIRETTLTYDNVQNVRVTQGPLERFFGIANVIVETAGGGDQQQSGVMPAHVGQIEGIANATRIRELIMARVRKSQSAGLGDEADAPARMLAWSPQHIAVLREIADAARAAAM